MTALDEYGTFSPLRRGLLGGIVACCVAPKLSAAKTVTESPMGQSNGCAGIIVEVGPNLGAEDRHSQFPTLTVERLLTLDNPGLERSLTLTAFRLAKA